MRELNEGQPPHLPRQGVRLTAVSQVQVEGPTECLCDGEVVGAVAAVHHGHCFVRHAAGDLVATHTDVVSLPVARLHPPPTTSQFAEQQSCSPEAYPA